MKSISEPFIRRPIATALLTISVVLFGIYCYLKLPVSGLPQVDYPVIAISASFPGMTPETMANSVASPLEKELMGIQGLKEIYSENRLGSTSISLVFELDKSIDVAAMDVQAAITRAQHKLPSDMPSPPTYSKENPNSEPIFYIGLVSNTLTLGNLYDYAKTQVAQQISSINGVSNVQVYGASKAVRIDLDLQKIQSIGLSIDEVVEAVKKHSLISTTGIFKGQSRTLTLTTNGQIEAAKDFGNSVITSSNGLPVYLKDIAKCEDGLETDDLSMKFWGRKLPPFNCGVVLAVNQTPGTNTVEVAKRVRTLLPYLQHALPKSVELVPIYDKSKTILDSIGEVKETLLIAFILVTVVIFLFLGRVRETLIPVVAMPLSLLITFLAMKGLGYSLDNLSLMALTLAIGFLVDDAIVFLENVVRHMEQGMGPLEAAFKSAGEISFTILSMTLSLMATFLPLSIMSGQIGRVFKEFAVTIMISIFASGLVSLTVTPVMCARFLRKHGVRTYIENLAYTIEQKFRGWYGRTLSWFLKVQWVSWWLWTVCLIGTVLLFIWLPKTFLPTGDSSAIRCIFMAQSGASPAKMKYYQEKLEAAVHNHPSVSNTVSVVGAGSHFQSNMGFMIAFIKPKAERTSAFSKAKKLSIEDVSNELSGIMAQIPGIIPIVKPMPVLDISTSAADNSRGKYSYTLSGLDSKKVYQSAETFKQRLRQVKGVVPYMVNSDVELSNPELNINYQRNKLYLADLTPANLENALGQAYSLNYVYLIKGEYEQYEVILAAQEKYRGGMQDLKWLFVKNGTGKPISIENVVQTKLRLGPAVVCHKANFPAATIFFNTFPGVPLSYVTKQIEKIAKETLPVDVLGEFGGEAKDFREAVLNLTLLLFLAVFVMYVVLGCLYEHWIHPITVLSTLPVALVGGLITLFVFQADFSLYAFIGLFMLIGIVKKNGIILVDFAVEKEKLGVNPEEAIHEACLERLRPIMMTSISTIFGVLPIALGFGADGASRIPLGLSVVGGMIFAQVLTLFVTPVIYLGLNRFSPKTE